MASNFIQDQHSFVPRQGFSLAAFPVPPSLKFALLCFGPSGMEPRLIFGLWGDIPFRAVLRHDLAKKPLYRFELVSTPSEKLDRDRAEAIKAAVSFTRTALSVVTEAQKKQTSAFSGIKSLVAGARENLDDNWIRQVSLARDIADPKTTPGKFAALARRLEDVASNLSDSYQVSIEEYRSQDQQRKDPFRALLQQSLVGYAEITLALDEMTEALAKEWKLKADLTAPHPTIETSLETSSVPKPVRSDWSNARSALTTYYSFDDQTNDGQKILVKNRGKGSSPGIIKSCTLVPGRFGQAVSMNGKDSHVLTDVSWRLATTVSLWVRVTDRSQPYYLLDSVGGAGAFSIQQWDSGAGTFTFALHSNSKWLTTAESHRLAVGEWNHVAIVLDRPRDEVRYFLDGRLVHKLGLPLQKGTWEGNVVISTPWQEKALPGDVDDFAIFDRALDEDLVFQVFEGGKQGLSLAVISDLESNLSQQGGPK